MVLNSLIFRDFRPVSKAWGDLADLADFWAVPVAPDTETAGTRLRGTEESRLSCLSLWQNDSDAIPSLSLNSWHSRISETAVQHVAWVEALRSGAEEEHVTVTIGSLAHRAQEHAQIHGDATFFPVFSLNQYLLGLNGNSQDLVIIGGRKQRTVA
jgi:hypothetical protein